MDAAQREERRNSIGASDIAGVLGLSRWKTPLSVWFDKVEGSEDSQSVAAELGNLLEPWLLEKFTAHLDQAGHTWEGVVAQPRYTHPDHAFITCTPDYCLEVDGVEGGCECKTAGEYRSSEWPEGGLPDEYYAQVQHQMACTGWPWVYVPFLIGNRKFDVRFVPRNEDFIRVLTERAADFWERFVIPKQPPAPSGADVDAAILKALYPGGGEEVLRLDEMGAERDRYKELAAQIRSAQEEQKAIQQLMMAAMGDSEVAFIGEHKVTWKTVNKKEYVVKASSFRQLRIG